MNIEEVAREKLAHGLISVGEWRVAREEHLRSLELSVSQVEDQGYLQLLSTSAQDHAIAKSEDGQNKKPKPKHDRKCTVPASLPTVVQEGHDFVEIINTPEENLRDGGKIKKRKSVGCSRKNPKAGSQHFFSNRGNDDIVEKNGNGQKKKNREPKKERQKHVRPRREGAPRRYPVLPEHACCREKIHDIKQALEPALLTQKEREKSLKAKGKASSLAAPPSTHLSASSSSTSSSVSSESLNDPCGYNRARLQQGLVQHAYDVHGNCIVHQCCLEAELHISAATTLAAHKCAVSKKEPLHGLCGRKSNHSKKLEQQAFIAWVKCVRNPASSVQGAEISSGAAYYLPEVFRQLKFDKKSRLASTRGGDSAFVEVAFRRQCEHNPPLVAPSGASLVNWMHSYFGAGSENGHTTIQPRKPVTTQPRLSIPANFTAPVAAAAVEVASVMPNEVPMEVNQTNLPPATEKSAACVHVNI